VAKGDDRIIEQIRKQLEKLVRVLKVRDLTGGNLVERDLMLISVFCPPGKRGEIVDLVELFGGKVVDIDHKHMMVELTGPEQKIDAFIDLCRPYGITSLARTGIIAMPRGHKAGADNAVPTAMSAEPTAHVKPADDLPGDSV